MRMDRLDLESIARSHHRRRRRFLMRHIYLAATGQNRGKTTVSLGVLDGFQRRGLSTGFIKPVGQRTVIEDGVPADEDAVLMKTVFDLPEPLGQMSPIHIPRGFTQAYIEGKVVEDLGARIRAAHASFAANRQILLIEGTGHAGVGAVIDLSNAVVAAMLGAPAVIVSEGGVGRPIDEIVLNKALFERSGVRVAGAIVNKVDLAAKPDLARTLERGLARHDIPLLGVLPYRPILSNPTLAMVLEGVHGETIHPGPDLDQVIGGVAIGAMEPFHMLQRIGERSLVIVPGDRDDVIAAIVHAHRIGAQAGRVVAVLVAGGDHQQPEADDVGQWMNGAARIARIGDAGGETVGDPEPALDLAQNQQTTIGGQAAAVEAGDHFFSGNR